MTIGDIWLCAWLAFVAGLLYVALPKTICRFAGPRARYTPAGLTIALVVTGAAGTSTLAASGLLSALGIAAVHLAFVVGVMWWSHRSLAEAADHLLRTCVTKAAAPPAAPRPLTPFTNPQLAAMVMVASMLLVTRVLPSLSEARLFDPTAYGHLTVVRQVLAGGFTGDIAPLVDAWMAALSLLAAVDAATIVRFLPPLLACAVTVVLIRRVWQWSGRCDVALGAGMGAVLAASGLAVAAPWSEALTRQHGAVGEYVVALLVLLGHRDGRRLELTAAAWLILAAFVSLATVPVALALGCAVLYRMVHTPVRLPEPRTAGAWGMLVLASGLGTIPPRVVSEPDVVARQALRILDEGRPAVVVSRAMPTLAGHRWIRLQPPSAFAGADTERWTYVFVEKASDPQRLPTDQAVLAAAEQAVHVTPGARLYYDDDELRVYELPPLRGPDARHGDGRDHGRDVVGPG
jgi:hypothetical protein